MNFGAGELGIVLVIVLVLFGGAKLPKLARSLGEAQREFRKSHDDTKADDDTEPGADGTGTDASEPPPT